MLPKSLLIANRGEIAIRVMRAAAELGIHTVAVFSDDDARSLHTRKADEARALGGVGAAAYLDGERIIAVAKDSGCDAIHPGYGFLSENPAFARRCADAGVGFVGPRPDLLELFGDKAQARLLASRCGVPVMRGTSNATSLDEARSFLASLSETGAMMIKAVAGGGGRGMRAVHRIEDVEEAFKRCQSEARAAFGNGDVYVEQMMPRARHIEVQVAGDGTGEVVHFWERECSVQRRHQKIVEIAPSPMLPSAVRERLLGAALRMASEVRYESLGTFEFLVNAEVGEGEAAFAFIEANARLQVEHTVTEEVTGIDLVKLQLQLAGGKTLAELGLRQANIPAPRGFAIQMRINMESMGADGIAKPSGGTLTAFDAPSGPGVRTDTFAYTGYTTNPNFDSLLAKLIAHSASPHFADALTRAYRALSEFRIEGVRTNIAFLQSLLLHPEFAANRIYTRFVEDRAAELIEKSDHRRLFFEQPTKQPQVGAKRAGAKIDASDPLAVLHHGKSGGASQPAVEEVIEAVEAPIHDIAGPENTVAVAAPMQGTIVSVDVHEGQRVHRGQQLFVMEAMKMEHVIEAHLSGVVRQITVTKGDAIFEGHPLAFIEEADVEAGETAEAGKVDLDRVRPDLAEVQERHAAGLDPARPEAVARRRKTRQRTTRENIEDLCDPGTFVEYGPLVIAAQRRRRTVEDLIKNTPADGMVAGIGSVNGNLFEESQAQCILMSYDYTVLAGTQGQQN
ncbi:MAG TPA: biotin carboxylase N-terminal domain-containing protein, partial [Candidatus Acidoferrales bacterium]|nr:biotin carboxylase N-terminal domain-containing protein [Candidatus Acidoferrales bacterium]